MSSEKRDPTLGEVKQAARGAATDSREDAERREWGLNRIASKLGEADDLFMLVDRGTYVSPRYAVYVRPKIGMETSRAFDGQYVPTGKIAKISRGMGTIKTDTGFVYVRRKMAGADRGESGMWTSRRDPCWALVSGKLHSGT